MQYSESDILIAHIMHVFQFNVIDTITVYYAIDIV